jgi:uridine phosphorylase
MFNHHRGLWGYTGLAADGELMTIQATGMGGPSAAIVLEELCDLGLERAVRVGTCGALDGTLDHGDVVAATEVICADGTSRALGAAERQSADPGLVAAAVAAGARPAVAVSTDLFYDRDPARAAAWRAAGAEVVEMEAATLLRVGELRGIPVACLLAVTDRLGAAESDRDRVSAEGLETAVATLARVASATFGVPFTPDAPTRGLVDPDLEEEKAAREARARDGDRDAAPGAADPAA